MSKTRQKWTEEDNERIRNLAGKLSLSELAQLVDRSEVATRVQASKLGLKVTFADAKIKAVISKPPANPQADGVEQVIAPVAIERALSIYQQLQERDQSVVLQARKILTKHIYGMVDQGETDEQRLTVGGLVHLKSVERDHTNRAAATILTG
jgi:hypothetical protein